MYLRFETLVIDHRSFRGMGVFQMAGELLETADLKKIDHQLIKGSLRWYNENVHVPACLKSKANRRAQCWFKSSENDAIQRIWDLVALLKEHGIAVRVVKKRELGKIIYEDKWQVVAFPKRR